MNPSCFFYSSSSIAGKPSLSSLPSTILTSWIAPKFLGTIGRSRGIWRGFSQISGSGRCRRAAGGTSSFSVLNGLLPADPWSPTIDSQSIASQLFAVSLLPCLGFLYYITKSKTAPKLTLFGFYFLLAFVGVTIPAGIYAKLHYGTSLSNVDWLHGGAESLLTLTNLFIVLGLRSALRKVTNAEKNTPDSVPDEVEQESSETG
ncbi:hypothetical protein AXF42_Ash019646 [Apostasia shenzhenica]|uniref:1-acyl-sn-glycerol-3-phosphate acyltransferase delta n=1 Tax=Apostasia shenzhenica TaxID=1088818 RepID=A0A2I0A3J8_9ASPA|nr:hypothetical protein AXF42_Ash019646 [Apostasia shenzhenica]